MAYTPTEWKRGDVVTSAKLNKLEEGVGVVSAPFVIEWAGGEVGIHTAQTCQETYEAFMAGRTIAFKNQSNGSTEEGDEYYTFATSLTKQSGDGYTNWELQCGASFINDMNGYWQFAD